MRDIEREWLQLKFKGTFHDKRGDAFQDWFGDLMSAAYPGDFQRVRAYGRRGDLKCDGFLSSKGTVFQCYATRDMKLASLLEKMSTDFAGAKKNWPKDMRGWTFVHNDPQGLPADAVKLLTKFRRANPKLAIAELTYEGLESLALGLKHDDQVRLFGRPPTRKDFDTLGFAQLALVLEHLRTNATSAADGDIKPVSPRKLEANALSAMAADCLRLGRQREPLVDEFLSKHPDPSLGEDIAAAFQKEYRRLRDAGFDADRVFARLQEFAGGSTRGGPDHEAAVLAVMSYLFERCDIFEAPSEDGAGAGASS